MNETEAGSGVEHSKKETRKDFFISYTHADQKWARWIAWCLEQGGYGIIYDEWDFPAGSNFVYEMEQALKRAERLVAVLSPAYLRSKFGFSEWAAKFRVDPDGAKRLLVPVLIEPCDDKEGLLRSIISIILVGLDKEEARERLLAGVQQKPYRPTEVAFPGTQNLALEQPAFPPTLAPLWNIPLRNPHFAGREDLLLQLANELKSGRPQPQALSGLGGVGKTQIAVEYAYQHAKEYDTALWLLADSRKTLLAGYAALARLLDLQEGNERNQMKAVDAVKRWFATHRRWLLILDNADEPELWRDFLPQGGGHVLLTTRAQAVGGLAHLIGVREMDDETGALLLLRRAGLIGPNETIAQADARVIAEAQALVSELGGLPLALDQAAAYIEEVGCSVADYRVLYQKERSVLLQRRGGKKPDHPESVTITFLLAFKKVESKNPAAADLLRLCAFLAFDAISEEIIVQGATHLGPNLASVGQHPLELDKAIASLRAYSLLRRDPVDKMLSLHRLVLAVLRDDMDRNQQIRREWSERAVRAVNEAFPDVEFASWPVCMRLLPHALACAELIKQEQMMFLEAGRLLNQTGIYLCDRGRYAEAEPLYVRALTISNQWGGDEHANTGSSLNNLALLYKEQGRYEQAETLFQRALNIHERVFGPDHPEVATDLSNLADLYYVQRKYAQAEPLYERALAIREQRLGPDHPHTTQSLNNLAALYKEQSKYARAEDLVQRALTIRKQQSGPEHPDTAQCLNILAALYIDQGRCEQAKPLYEQALAILERTLGGQHPLTLRVRKNYAVLPRTRNASGR